MTQLHLLSGGAAYGLVSQLEARFLVDTGCTLVGSFNAVGAMRDQLLAGVACDVLILTAALIAQLEAGGHVVAGSARRLGSVKMGIAVKATAGIHFMNVMKQLGIDAELASRLRPFPNGASAMGEMARSGEPGVIGCTQVTEILQTPGVVLVAPFPPAFELATVYSAAVSASAGSPQP